MKQFFIFMLMMVVISLRWPQTSEKAFVRFQGGVLGFFETVVEKNQQDNPLN